jgi:WD40 repeat protein
MPVVLSLPIAHSRVTFQGHIGPVESAVFSPDGGRVLTASEDNTGRLWEAEKGKLLVTFQGHTGAVLSAVFSPDGGRVLTASEDNTARLWEANSGKLLVTFKGHTDQVLRAVFSLDGRRVLTGSQDNTARLWEAASGKLLATLQCHTGGLRPWRSVRMAGACLLYRTIRHSCGRPTPASFWSLSKTASARL